MCAVRSQMTSSPAPMSSTIRSGSRSTIACSASSPDPAVATAPRDNRSDARKRLDALESAYLRRMGKADAEGWTDKDKQFRYTPLPDLLKAYNRVKQEVANEDAAERLANGTGFARKIQVRI